MIYLASPYSDPHPEVREQRYHRACVALAEFVRAGQPAFSPIVHGHPLTALGVPGGWEFWRGLNKRYLERCDELVVLTLDGWQQSVGVQAEIAWARGLRIPTSYRSPPEVAKSPATSPTLARVALDREDGTFETP